MSRRDPSTAAELVSGKPKDSLGGLKILKEWLRSAVVDNLALKAVAFLLALTLFILVHSDEDEIVPVTVKLTYAAPREGLTLLEQPPSSVRVSIQGSRRRLRRLVESELDPIQVTLTNTGEFVFQSDMVRPLPEGLSVASISPASISLVYETTSDKTVAVRARTVGSVAPGFRLGSVRVEPSQLDILGAESALARVDELVTQPLSIDGATEPLKMTIALAVPPFPVQLGGGERSQNPQDFEVVVHIDVVRSQGLASFSDAGVRVVAATGVPSDAATRWKVTPAAVDFVLRGDELALQSLNREAVSVSVRLHPADVVARVERDALLEVSGAPEGIAIELKPATVRLSPR